MFVGVAELLVALCYKNWGNLHQLWVIFLVVSVPLPFFTPIKGYLSLLPSNAQMSSWRPF